MYDAPGNKRPTEKSPTREQFWSDYQAKEVEFIMKKYRKETVEEKLKETAKKLARERYSFTDNETAPWLIYAFPNRRVV